MAEDSTVEAPESAAAAPATPEAPWGLNPRTNQPYKRDPALFEHLRGKPRGTASRAARRRSGPKPVQPANSSRPPAPSVKRGKPEYGKKLMTFGMAGASFVPDPVDRAIVRQQLPALCVAVDKLAAENPAVAEFLDKVLMRMTGGAWTDLAMVAATGAGMIAMNHGFSHPMLSMLLGAGLQAAQAQAETEAAAAEAFRAQMEREIWHAANPPVDEPPAAGPVAEAGPGTAPWLA